MKHNITLTIFRKNMTIQKKMIMFLYIVEQDVSHRFATKNFRHDVTIVKRIFRQILIILNRLYLIFVVLLINDISVANHIRENKKFWSYFKNCVETLNEIHIHVYVSNELQQFYKNRKNIFIQNVLIVCDFNMRFIYLLIEWKKIVNDAKVIQNAKKRDFYVSSNKYYLIDVEYTNIDFTMILYRDVRYHLKKQIKANLKSQNKKKLFNLRYASLRNVIEREFKILKRRFKIIRSTLEYALTIQMKLIYALTNLNNFINRYNVRLDKYQMKIEKKNVISKFEFQ